MTTKTNYCTRLISLTLTGRQWMTIHDLLYAVLTSPKRADSRQRRGPDNLERCKNLVETIKVSTQDFADMEKIKITDTTWVMSQVSWVLNEAAGFRVKGLTSELVGDINTQLQRKA